MMAVDALEASSANDAHRVQKPAPPDMAAAAAWALRERLLNQLDAAFAKRSLQVMMVKGAAMAQRYAKPWQRTMADIDLLVKDRDMSAVKEALLDSGLSPQAPHLDRAMSKAAFFEESFIHEQAGLLQLVELHTSLDKLVKRPIDHDAIFARASARAPSSSLLLPTDEDHVLLQVVHVAASDFVHPAAWNDLNILWTGLLSKDEVLSRARQWRLSTALYLSLRHMRRHGIPVQDHYLRACAPPWWRKRWLARKFSDSASAPRGEMGWAWIERQSALRDDAAGWCFGVAKYAATRVIDRILIAT